MRIGERINQPEGTRPKHIPVWSDSPETDSIGYDDDNPLTNGEYHLIDRIFHPEWIVFDIGANEGLWTEAVLSRVSGVKIFAFEPVPDTFDKLKKRLRGTTVSAFNLGLSYHKGNIPFYYYKDDNGLSTAHRRNEYIESRIGVTPTEIKVATTTLFDFCSTHDVAGIDFLKIDTEGSEFDVLQGACSLLDSGRINAIQFEYGGCYIDAGVTLYRIYSLLSRRGYAVYRILSRGILHIPRWRESLESYRYSNYLALKNPSDHRPPIENEQS